MKEQKINSEQKMSEVLPQAYSQCNVISRFFSPYKPFKIEKYNWWFNFYQGNFNIKNCFILGWCWICDNLHPAMRFSLSIFRFLFPFLYRSRALFSFNIYTWDKRPALYLSVELLFLPSLDFRIGNGKTWIWIRNENWYGYKCNQRNKKIKF